MTLKYLETCCHEQRVTIKFLTNERIDAHEISARLNAQFDMHIYPLCTIQFWMCEVQCGREDVRDEHRFGRPDFDYIDAKIIFMLEKAPFESACSIADTLNVHRGTMSNHLQEKL
jgi:hypothetical protein